MRNLTLFVLAGVSLFGCCDIMDMPFCSNTTEPPEVPEPTYTCNEQGMYQWGTLVVSSDPGSDASGMCESFSLKSLDAGGYEACCDGECCSWVGEPDGKLTQGEECESSADCTFGLLCRVKDDGPSQCDFAKEGELCNEAVLCDSGLYCDEAKTFPVCSPPATEEGAQCAVDAQCAFPMSCVCLGGECACNDGSLDDPCHSDTCQLGLYCALFGDPDTDNRCFEGKKSDPCAFDWHCQDGLECGQLASGEFYCVILLDQGDVCQGVDEFTVCSMGLICNAATDPNQCTTPGLDGDPCLTEADCSAGYACLLAPGQAGACYDGTTGDVCYQEGDCADGLLCIEGEEGGSLCYRHLEEGSICMNLPDEFTLCAPELVCNTAYGPHKCKVPGEDGDPCLKNDECGAGTHCIETFATCYDGGDGDPCNDAEEHCAEGFKCHPEIAFCYDGDDGDKCLTDGHCADGYVCVGELEECYDGSPGDPCSSPSHCMAGLSCLELAEQALCFQFLAEGEECPDEILEFAACSGGLICNGALESPKCTNPGTDGDPCIDDKQCALGYACVVELEVPACYNGDDGDPCIEGQLCAKGYACSADTTLCYNGDDGDPCDEDADCAEGFSCNLNLGKCQDGNDGDPCGGGQECAEGFACIAFSNTCQDGSVGDPCGSDDDCSSGLGCLSDEHSCASGLPGSPCEQTSDCKAGGVCLDVNGGLVCVATLGQGDECGEVADLFAVCPPGTTCNFGFQPSQCAVPAGDEHPCAGNADCAKDFNCNADAKACFNGDDGDPCSGDEQCADGFICLEGESACYDGSVGDPCATGEECQSGECDELQCT